jgi:predicted anti-sigma-YlaC factor YlaD
MKHSQFKRWILDDEVLEADQQNMLKQHLDACDECRQLQLRWEASRKMLKVAAPTLPAPGFSNRWRQTFAQKKRIEKVRHYRLTLTGLVLLAFFASLATMTVSGTFGHVLAHSFNALAHAAVTLTNSFTVIGRWVSRLPLAAPIAAGFVFSGLMTAFVMISAFALWDVKNRRRFAHESETF